MDLLQLATLYTETDLKGRYINLNHIAPLLNKQSRKNTTSIIGASVLNKPIYACNIGNGSIKILMWSQMHGNESTTTKALFDFFNFLESENETALELLNYFNFCFIPILNPDGAELYTRENANGVDLNRDAQNVSQPESSVLRKQFEQFKPDYCFNLHDQRSVFGVGATGKAAMISFLAPSYNEAKSVNFTRKKAMQVIVAMHAALSTIIPGHVALFDDSFNINCVGDWFQNAGTPTILFEAGHFGCDYSREESRKMIFISFLSALLSIRENVVVCNEIENYLLIPQNKVNFYDIIYNNAIVFDDGVEKMINFAVQYRETLVNETVQLIGVIVAIGNLQDYFAHEIVDCKKSFYTDTAASVPQIGARADFKLNEVKIFTNGIKLQ